MGEQSAKTTGKSTMIVETNITYNQELKLDDEIDINLVYFDHDKKRLQYKMEIVHKKKKYLASTIEVLSLYVDLNTRKVSKFEDEKVQIMNTYIPRDLLKCGIRFKSPIIIKRFFIGNPTSNIYLSINWFSIGFFFNYFS